MDNTNDNSNKPSEENAIEIAPPSEIELVEDTETTTTSTLPEETKDEIMESITENDEDESSDEKADEPHHSLSRLELESLIQRYLDDSEKLKSTLKSQKEMYNASFENDAEFSQETEVANNAKKKVAAIKQRITQQPAVQSASERMEELKSEIKDVNEAISGLAEQYQTVAGTNQIVQDDGQILEIVRNFKVIRKKA